VTMPRTSALTFTGETRRRRPKASQNRRVPLWTVEPEGEEFQGIIRVPLRLCNTEEHSNAHLEFEALITANLARWVEWRRLRGWILTETPLIQGPFDPPEGDREKQAAHQARAESVIGRSGEANAVLDWDYPQELKWYTATARFKRDDPVYVRLEDMLTFRHMALLYGIDPDRDKPLSTPLPAPLDHIEVEGGLDPLQVAEERRQALGLKRSDYLMGELWEPL